MDRTCKFEYSSMRTLISGAHGNQHSPELTTPTQWNARSQNSPQNASASCYMHIAAFTYHPTTTHHASKLPFLFKKKFKKKKLMKANFKASSKQNHLIPIIDQSTDHFKIHYGIYPCRQCRQSIIHEPK